MTENSETTRLFLIRHAETDANSGHRYQGLTDNRLNEKGLWQARRLGERLSGEKLSAVYSSNLTRARETAEIIAGYHDLDVVTLKDLRELDFGEWEGLTGEEIAQTYPQLFERWVAGDFDVEIPGGEKRKLFLERVDNTLSQILDAHRGHTVALVSHGGPLKCILCDALATNPMGFWYFRLDNASVNLVEYDGDSHVVMFVNDTCHLRDERKS
jgi:broad specificity phosphatase PhoE